MCSTYQELAGSDALWLSSLETAVRPTVAMFFLSSSVRTISPLRSSFSSLLPSFCRQMAVIGYPAKPWMQYMAIAKTAATSNPFRLSSLLHDRSGYDTTGERRQTRDNQSLIDDDRSYKVTLHHHAGQSDQADDDSPPLLNQLFQTDDCTHVVINK